MPVDKVSIEKFAASIKDQYPAYKDMNDTLLTQKIIEKYPQYQKMVDYSPQPSTDNVDKGVKQTTQKVNEGLQFNGTFQPDLEGEKKGLYLNDPDYQKQKQDFVGKIMTDDKGRLLYPQQDEKGNWYNYYTKESLSNFDPRQMEGKILQVPHEGLWATNGKQFITPKRDQQTGDVTFPDVQTPTTPTLQELPAATVYGKSTKANPPTSLTGPSKMMADESGKQGGQLDQVFKSHPDLPKAIESTLDKYGEQYRQSLGSGSGAMMNILQKTVEDKYGLNIPTPKNIDEDILTGHLNVLNNFDANRTQFENQQKELQRQADLLVDHSKRTGMPIDQNALTLLAQKQSKNIDQWNIYSKAVNFSKNYVDQPDVKNYLTALQQKKQGLDILDEIRQRAFPNDTQAQVNQDEYDRRAIEGKLSVWDYLKTAAGRAASGIANIGETAMKVQNPTLPSAVIENLNNNAQRFINNNLPHLSPEAIQEMAKGNHGLSLMANDVASTLGSFAPYLVPGMVGEGAVAKGLTAATALAEQMPQAKKEAMELGLTGKAYDTYTTAKPIVDAAFMSLLPNVKFAKGYEKDVAESIVKGEFNNPGRMLVNLAGKIIKDPSDVAHMQAMLTGTYAGERAINSVTNSLQASEDSKRGIVRQEQPLSTNLSGSFNPQQTVVMAMAGKIMESIPTAAKGIGNLRFSDVNKAYNNAETNLVELAATNLNGVSDKINELLKKDPGNVYAQHIKNTIEDFSKAELEMPEGLHPEQKAALFDIQKKTARLKTQQESAHPDYKNHIQKNIDELTKQIPVILKDQSAANKYLQDAHNDFVNNIPSPNTQENGKETENAQPSQAEGRQEIGNPNEGAEVGPEAAPSYLLSRHADTKKDEEGKVSGPNQHPLSPDGKKDANDLADEVKEHADQTAVPVTKIVHSGLERAGETARKVAEKTGATTVSDPDLNTWNIKDFDDASDDEFKDVQKWFGEHPDERIYQGPIEKFKGKSLGESLNEYANRTIAAHAKYENEPASTLMIDHSNNMMVMDAYRKNGNKWDENAIQDYLNAKKPEPATLVEKPNVSYPKITNIKLKENAVQVGSTTPLLQREQGETGSAGSGRGRMESSQQGGEPAGEGSQSRQPAAKEKGQDTGKEIKGVEDELPFIEEEGDNEFTSTKNAVAKQKIEDAGLEHPMREAAREFGDVWKQAQDKLSKGFDIEKLVKTLEKKPRAVTDLENAMILFHQSVKESQLDAASKDLDEARKNKDRTSWNDAYDRRQKLLDDLQHIYNADKKIGRETARGLNARKMMVDRRFSLVNMQLEKRASLGGEPLNEEQIAELQKQHEDIKKAKDALEARVKDLENENAQLKASGAVGDTKATAGTRKTREQFKKERSDIVQRMRADLLKAAKGGEGLTSSIPLAAQLKAVAPHIKDLVKSFIDEGVTKLEDITKHIKDILKPNMPDIEDRHIHDLIAGEYNEPSGTQKQPSAYQQVKAAAKVQKYMVSDPQTRKLQADYERSKDKYLQGLRKDQDKSLSMWQKTQNVFLKYERAIKLSNPITLGKLGAAAITRLATTPLEEGVGAAYSKVFPGLAKMAPGEAGLHVKALAKGYKEAFMKGLSDAATTAKGGKTDIEAIFGDKGQLPPEALDFFGQLHSAIKAPVKRFAFERSFQKRIANNIKNGVSIDAMTEARIAMEAYKDAQRSIFMQDNPVSKGWTQAMGALEKSGDTGQLIATIGKWLLPFVKIPTNIVGETISHVAGPEMALAKVIATSLGKGLKNLDQDEAESIMRNLKKGTIGHIALMAGYLNPQIFGGYYQKGEKRNAKDVKVGDMKIGGVTIPAWALEAPLFQAMQLGATVRRIKDEKIKGKEKGIGEGIWGGALGLMSHEPLIDEPSRIGGMLASPTERQYFIGELAKSSLIPAASEYAAKVLDPLDKRSTGEKLLEPENKRQPATVKEHIESAIPLLRENVPGKKPKGRSPSRPHR